MENLKMRWSVPEKTIKIVKCLYCGETGDTKWAKSHLKEKQYYRLPIEQQKNKSGVQFVVIEKTLDGEQ